MELTQLRSFVAVAKHQHLTRAAETLHLSQPALSGQIKALEDHLGVPLFERSSTGMTLTLPGRNLLKHAEEIIGAVAELNHSAQAMRGQPMGKLRVGTLLDPALLRVGELLAHATATYPQIELELHQVVSHEALEGIRGGTLDASFYFGALPEADLSCIPLRQIGYRVALPTAWAQELLHASWDTLAERPWIVAPERSSHRQLVLEMFKGRAAPPAKTIEADNESVINNLIESGVGLSLVRDEIALASAEAGRIVIWPEGQLTTRLWLAYAADRDTDPLIVALLQVLHEVWSDTIVPHDATVA